MTVQELIEELQVYVDIGYGWMNVESLDKRPILVILDAAETKLVIVEKD